VKGPKAADLVQKLTTNDVHKLFNGKVQYSCFPNAKGGIVDDLLVYRYSDNKYLLVVNAANIQKDWGWIRENNTVGAILENASDEMSLLAVQGPMAEKTLQRLTRIDLSGMKYYTFEVGDFAGCPEVIVSATGYTGAGGFELYCRNPEARQIWDAVLEAGQEYGIKPVGLAARDTLRMEMGFCLYGNDIDETTSPLEAGLGWITKFTEGNDFIDRERLEQQKAEGPRRRLVGFKMLEKGIPRQHYEIAGSGGERIGEVTSGTMSPMLNAGIGLGYVQSAYAKPGTPIHIHVRKKMLPAEVVELPIYRKDQD
jgi:aminomethyltransferase